MDARPFASVHVDAPRWAPTHTKRLIAAAAAHPTITRFLARERASLDVLAPKRGEPAGKYTPGRVVAGHRLLPAVRIYDIPPQEHHAGTRALTRYAAAERTLLHELGHHVHLSDRDPRARAHIDRVVDAAHALNHAAVSAYGQSSARERFAETFRAALENQKVGVRDSTMLRHVLRLRGLPVPRTLGGLSPRGVGVAMRPQKASAPGALAKTRAHTSAGYAVKYAIAAGGRVRVEPTSPVVLGGLAHASNWAIWRAKNKWRVK